MILVPLAWMLALTGLCQSMFTQRLTCSHDSIYGGVRKVWCKQDSDLCCTGFAFGDAMRALGSEGLHVEHDAGSFTVTVRQLPQGEGVYWCGLLQRNNTIIKLAEKYFYESPPLDVWGILRWILMPLLPLVTIIMYCYTSRKVNKQRNKEKVEADAFEDICMTSPQAADGQ
ncbi:hypothetical protein AGOR_G00080260 [Albula goreensis]|uniref:Uncharacterized protein n=1 Tax=Albula goreensis TaxID=1534307 RepID=A0A8T3DIP4_9TELE|nr:hypothetical protein AGOR_G00080260 [Albula goreensis]